MGELAQAANGYFVIPNKIIGIMSALSLTAGIVGRRYNISNSGLNLYSTVMVRTGGGKDAISEFCQRVLRDESLFGTNGLSFLGPQKYTGPKGLLDELAIRPCYLSILSEAALLYKTDAGDQHGLTRIVLQAYTRSGRYSYIGQERYSSKQDSTPLINAPALSILNEAVPKTLIEQLKKRESIDTGELPRMWIFKVSGKKPYNNINPHQLNMSYELSNSLKRLLADCYTVQNSEMPDVVTIPVPEQYRAYANWCTDQENALIDEDPSRAIMYTRAAHKVLKVAALLTVIDGRDTIPESHWSWAAQLFDYEMAHIDGIIGNSSDISLALDTATDIIVKLLNHGYTKETLQLPEVLTSKSIFTESVFRQASMNRPNIRDLGTSARYSSPKSGAKIILEYMVSEGLLTQPKDVGYTRKGRTSKYYQVTKEFKNVL
jgi:hypothetical protein